MREFYIRQIDSQRSLGPYPIEKLIDLARTGAIDVHIQVYDDKKEHWTPIKENQELFTQIFLNSEPTSRLALQKVAPTTAASATPQSQQHFTLEAKARPGVEDIIATAAGAHYSSARAREEDLLTQRAATLVLPLIGTTMALLALSNLIPEIPLAIEEMRQADWLSLLKNPLLLLGVLDAFLALCAFFAATEVFPIIRLRVAIGLGYFGFLAWSWYEYVALFSLTIGTLGVYYCSFTIRFWHVLIGGGLAVCGVGVYLLCSLGQLLSF